MTRAMLRRHRTTPSVRDDTNIDEVRLTGLERVGSALFEQMLVVGMDDAADDVGAHAVDAVWTLFHRRPGFGPSHHVGPKVHSHSPKPAARSARAMNSFRSCTAWSSRSRATRRSRRSAARWRSAMSAMPPRRQGHPQHQ
jgi:hypothetical protein